VAASTLDVARRGAEGEVGGAVAFEGRRAGRGLWLPAGVWLLIGRSPCCILAVGYGSGGW